MSRSKRPDVTAARSLAPPQGGTLTPRNLILPTPCQCQLWIPVQPRPGQPQQPPLIPCFPPLGMTAGTRPTYLFRTTYAAAAHATDSFVEPSRAMLRRSREEFLTDSRIRQTLPAAPAKHGKAGGSPTATSCTSTSTASRNSIEAARQFSIHPTGGNLHRPGVTLESVILRKVDIGNSLIFRRSLLNLRLNSLLHVQQNLSMATQP